MNTNDTYEFLQHTQHYSSLRFAMLGVFLAASAGLLALYFADEIRVADPRFRGAIQAFGIILASAFGVFEIAASRRYRDAANQIPESYRETLFGTSRVKFLGPITLLSITIYSFALLIWILTIIWT